MLSAFQNISQTGSPDKAIIRDFLKTYFEGPNMEFEKWIPSDFVERSVDIILVETRSFFLHLWMYIIEGVTFYIFFNVWKHMILSVKGFY